MDLEFEWDPEKASANEVKHGVSFAEASTVFGDPLSFSVADPRHSQGEARFAILGQSARAGPAPGRVLHGAWAAHPDHQRRRSHPPRAGYL